MAPLFIFYRVIQQLGRWDPLMAGAFGAIVLASIWHEIKVYKLKVHRNRESASVLIDHINEKPGDN